MAKVRKSSRKVKKTVKRKVAPRKTMGVDHEFILIAGGGFVVIILVMMFFAQ